MALSCDCFLRRSVSSGGLRPGSLNPSERVWIDSSDTGGASEGLKVTGNEAGVSGAIVEGVVRVDRKSRLLNDIPVKPLSCILTENYTTVPFQMRGKTVKCKCKCKLGRQPKIVDLPTGLIAMSLNYNVSMKTP